MNDYEAWLVSLSNDILQVNEGLSFIHPSFETIYYPTQRANLIKESNPLTIGTGTPKSDETFLLNLTNQTIHGLFDENEEILPGLFDILLYALNSYNEETFLRVLNIYYIHARQYLSKQLYDFFSQSNDFDEQMNDYFTKVEGRPILKYSALQMIKQHFNGYYEYYSKDIEFQIPVLTLNFPNKISKVKALSNSSTSKSATIKLDIPGISGGWGRKKKVSVVSKYARTDKNFQLQVGVKAKVRKFTNRISEHWLLDIKRVFQSTILVSEGNKSFYSLQPPEEKHVLDTFGAEMNTNETDETDGGDYIINIIDGYSAIFSLNFVEILSKFTEINIPNNVNLVLDFRSESQSDFEFDFLTSESNTPFHLWGPNKGSLRLFIDPKST